MAGAACKVSVAAARPQNGRAHVWTPVTSSYPMPPFFFNDTATTEIYTLSLHDALPISRFLSTPTRAWRLPREFLRLPWSAYLMRRWRTRYRDRLRRWAALLLNGGSSLQSQRGCGPAAERESTRLDSRH